MHICGLVEQFLEFSDYVVEQPGPLNISGHERRVLLRGTGVKSRIHKVTGSMSASCDRLQNRFGLEGTQIFIKM